MLRRAGQQLARGARAFQTSTAACEEAAKASTTKFTEEFRKHAPSYLNDPSYTTTFHKATSDVEAPTEVPAALKVKFVLPHSMAFTGDAAMVNLPAASGDMGVTPGHLPIIAQLRPGVVEVRKDADKEGEKFFVSGGWAFVHRNSTMDVVAVEGVKVSDIDHDRVRTLLAEATQKAADAKDEMERAAALVGQEVYSEMSAAH